MSAFTYPRGERLVEELGHGRSGGDVEVMLALVGRGGGLAWPGASYAGTDAFIVIDYDLGGTAWRRAKELRLSRGEAWERPQAIRAAPAGQPCAARTPDGCGRCYVQRSV